MIEDISDTARGLQIRREKRRKEKVSYSLRSLKVVDNVSFFL